MVIKERIEELRKIMKEHNMDAYIIPSCDSHQSEYVADHYKCRAFISGFTGSAGTVVVTLDDAGLWTDGRYFIQAEKQLEGSGIKLFKMGQPSVPTYVEWIKENVKEKGIVGFNGEVFSVNMLKNMKRKFASKKISINSNFDLIDEIWKDRPTIPCSKVFLHDIKFTGKSRAEKLAEVRKNMKKIDANYFVLSSLDDIAWLLNIRGRDVEYNPVTISYALIEEDKAYLFINLNKLSKEIIEDLNKDNVEVLEYDKVTEFVSKIEENKVVTYDPNKTNVKIYNSINDKVEKVEQLNITTVLKAIKNPVEIENMKNSLVRDGVAEFKFIKWLKESVAKGEEVTEISASDKLTDFRAMDKLFIEPSFNTIAGYKEHAAMMHYSATKESDSKLKAEGFLLIDSGGQYYDGTTDITRTISLGKLTEEEKKDFTLTLKGNIGLARAKFLEGTTGGNLDVLARKPLWDEGIDYKCGTGHGVGYLLNVHEGPQSVSRAAITVKLEPGMNVTDEPGVYKEGKHGIRIENMLLVVEDENTEYGGQFYKFETITFCPIDLDAVVPEMLTEGERNWLNNYHKETYEKLSPYLNDEEKEFLRKETREI